MGKDSTFSRQDDCLCISLPQSDVSCETGGEMYTSLNHLLWTIVRSQQSWHSPKFEHLAKDGGWAVPD